MRMMISIAMAILAAGPARAQEPSVPPGKVLKLAELNTEQIRSLDREKMIVIIPGGVLEQHGPYLPSFADGYRNEAAVEQLSQAVAARPGWTALLFPTIPLGAGGANEIGGHFSFPGSYGVRSTALRDVFVDVGSELGNQGFKWIFVVHLHGAPHHLRALDEAGDYFRDTYGGRMVHLYALRPVYTAGPQITDAAEAAETGLDMHAGRTETSDMLSIRPDLVAPGHRTARSLPGKTFDDLVRIAEAPGWPGYFGAPKQATAAEGQARIRARSKAAADYMWRIVDGTVDEREIPRLWTDAPEAVLNIERVSVARERAREERFAAWLAQRGTAQAVKPQPRVIGPHEGDSGVQPGGIRHQSKVGSLSTGASKLFVGTATIPAAVEIATHLHEIDEEVLCSVSGEIAATLDGKEHTVAQGGTVFPPGTWMTIANRTRSPAVVLGVLSRGELEECFRAMYSTGADETRHHALSLCRVRNP